MTNTPNTRRKKSAGPMVLFGLLSVSLYAVLLLEQEAVTDVFTRGGLFAFLPIATAFVFSFVHGSFTGKFWTAMGIEAARKKRREAQ